MKKFFKLSMFAYLGAICLYIPVQHRCVSCGCETHYDTFIDYLSSDKKTQYSHPRCSGFLEKQQK